MPKIVINGQNCGGASNYASAVSCLDENGNKSTVQDQIDILRATGGGGGGIVELTEAEWNTLPDSKYTDGILYKITDGEDLTAKNVECVGADGKPSTVQVELDKQNNNIVDIQNDVNNMGLKLLWKNDSPSSAFASQTLTVNDISNHSHIFIVFNNDEAGSYGNGQLLVSKEIHNNTDMWYISAYYESSAYIIRRKFKVNFDNGSIVFQNASNNTQNPANARCIPLAVYGIK